MALRYSKITETITITDELEFAVANLTTEVKIVVERSAAHFS